MDLNDFARQANREIDRDYNRRRRGSGCLVVLLMAALIVIAIGGLIALYALSQGAA